MYALALAISMARSVPSRELSMITYLGSAVTYNGDSITISY
jgi:hypothetical protein